jgi:hypothetical protein
MAGGWIDALIMRCRPNSRKEKRGLLFIYINRALGLYVLILLTFGFVACRAVHPNIETRTSGDVGTPATRDVAVMTILTHVHESAPAGTLDEVGIVEVLIKSAESPEQVYFQQSMPLGGSVVRPLIGISDRLEVEVVLYHPSGEEIARNSIVAQYLSGTVSVMGFEVAARQPNPACLSCSEPEALIRPLRLHDTVLYWSSGSQSVVGQRGELAVAVRPTAGLNILNIGLQDTDYRVTQVEASISGERNWWRVSPDDEELLGLALQLADLPDVVGIEFEGESGAGRFWP